MKVAIIAIGDELLIGTVTDTNTQFLSRAIDTAGGQVVYTCHVPDDGDAIYQAIELALRKADIVLTTGGLGPTKDDITKEVMCRYFGGNLRLDAEVEEHVRDIFHNKGLAMNELTAKQALVPESCTVVPNAVGTAPVMWFERDGKVLVAMPGVPREMCYVFINEVLPRVKKQFPLQSEHTYHRFLATEGISESDVNARLDATPENSPLRLVHVAYLPQTGYLKLRFDGHEEGVLDRAVAEFCKEFSDKVIFSGDITPAEALIERLRQKGLTVSSAESCTGGNIAHQITLVAGCSDVYAGTVVSYSNEVKANVLGVLPATLEAYGAVSLEVVREMVEGVSSVVGTDCAVATSGIAGPGGATPGKPVGTVCIGAKFPGGIAAETHHFTGDRSEVISRATVKAITMLLRRI